MPQAHFYSSKSQVFLTCQALLEGRTISHQTQIREAHGWRLGAIIHRLKAEYRWPVVTTYAKPSNVAHYRLDPDADLSRLRFPPSAKALGDEGNAT